MTATATAPAHAHQAEWHPHDTAKGRVEAYHRDGVILAPSVFSPLELEEIRETFVSQLESGRGVMAHEDHVSSNDILARYPRFVHPHRHPDTHAGVLARTHMVDDRLVSIVESLVGPAYGAQSMFYFKPPTARGQALHQDNNSLRAAPETCIAAWIAVDDADEDNGGLLVIPRSHNSEIMCTEAADETQSFSNSQVKLPPGVASRAVQTRMKAGDVLFFHGATVHGSHPNTTKDRFRRSLIFHYIPQASNEIYKFYQPLIRPRDGKEIWIDDAAEGGPCGEGWREEGQGAFSAVETPPPVAIPAS
jgi:hypothetical protein